MISIDLKNITKKYGKRTVLNNLNCAFTKGSNYLISGESGTGKTTLLNIINGYEKASCGTVKVYGRVEYLFQDELLFSNLSLEENLFIKNKLFGRTEEEIIEIAEFLGIIGLLNSKINVLSGGERQRAEFAQILLAKPDIVLLDEPTSRLDAANKEKMVKLISTVFDAQTVIVASHEKEFFDNSYTELKLEKGTLLNA